MISRFFINRPVFSIVLSLLILLAAFGLAVLEAAGLRVGVLDGTPLYACRYYMVKDHWQIYKHKEQDQEEKDPRARDKGDAPFLWAKRDGTWQAVEWKVALEFVSIVAPDLYWQRELATTLVKRGSDRGVFDAVFDRFVKVLIQANVLRGEVYPLSVAAERTQQALALNTDYTDPGLHERLMTVLDHRLGHHLASDVERAKIRSSGSDEPTAIDLSYVEPELRTQLDAAAVEHQLHHLLEQVMLCARECVGRAGLGTGQLDAIYLTGGSSALRPFQAALRRNFPGIPLVEGDLFGGVASGLAYAGLRR